MGKKNKSKKNKSILKTKNYKMLILIGLTLGIVGFIIFLLNCGNINDDTLSGEYNSTNTVAKTTSEGYLDSSQHYITDFYSYINNRDFVELVSIYDKPFRENTTIKTYFSENRINKFLNSIDGTLEVYNIVAVTDDRKDTEFITRMSYRYLLKYKIENQTFEENWKMTLISRDGGDNFLINSLFCESKGCGKSPFYK